MSHALEYQQSVEALVLSEKVQLPLSAATWVIAYLAKRGAGKSYDAAVQAEEMLKHGIPIVVIDGMGIWWGLRAGVDENGKLDSKKQGFPIVVFGGEHADLPLVPEQASDIAKAVVESNISCVLDISGFSKGASRKIVVAFLETLYQLNRVDRHVYMEETDMFAPQTPRGPEENVCLGAVDSFVRRGGNRNLGCTLITQRTAVLNKNVLTQADCLVILRTLAPQDKKAIQAWVQEATEREGTEEKMKAWYDSLKSLKNGEAYVWHPEEPVIDNFRTMFRKRETFHATREFIKSPEATKICLMDVGEFVGKFKTVFKEAPVKAGMPVPEDVKKLRLDLERAVNDKLQLNAEWNLKFKDLQDNFDRFKKNVQEQLNTADLNGYSRGRADAQTESEGKIADLQSQLEQYVLLAPLKEMFEKLIKEAMKEYAQSETMVSASVIDVKAAEAFNKRLSMVEDTLQKLQTAPAVSTDMVSTTEVVPFIEHRIDRPILQTDETKREGQLLTLVLKGFFDEKRRLKDIAKKMEELYLFTAGNAARDLSPILGRLITWHILQREEADGGGWLYSIEPGAKARIREVS